MNRLFKSLTVIICTNDEQDSLKKTVDVIVSTCSPADIDKIIICYPDFATAGCLSTVGSLVSEYATVPVVAYKQKKTGVGSALREAIEMSESSHTLIIDSDCSRDVEIVAKLIELSKIYPDKICKTSRWLIKNSFHNYGKVNYIANWFAQVFLKVLYGPVCSDMTDALQLVPTDIYQSVRWEETGFPFFIEMILKPMRLDAEYIEIPVNCYGRSEGKSNNSFKQKVGYFTCALHIRFMPKKHILLDR